MKGVFVHQQIEYRFEVSKDEFSQGDSLPCTLTLKNHSDAPHTISDLQLCIALGEIKLVKEKKPEAFEVVSSADLKLPWTLGPGQQQSAAWTFQLDYNCPISDKSHTLYFLYGPSASNAGQLPLQVQEHAHINAIVRTLETTFQFVLKGRKSSKGWVEAKLTPPNSRRLASVETLVLGLRREEGALALRYRFGVKKFAGSNSSGAIRKGKTEFERRLEENQFLVPGGFINHEAIEASIEGALKEVASEI